MTHPLTRAAKHLALALPFAALMTGTAALAQVSAAADDRGAETLKCLVQPDTPLAYPQQAIEHAGLIRVELTFTAADREPAVKALEHVKNAPTSPDDMPSPEEERVVKPKRRVRRRALLNTKTATEADIEAFVEYLRGEDDGSGQAG